MKTEELTEQIVHIQNDLDVVFAESLKLEKKLEIATKALKKYMTFCRHPAEEALREMKGVK